MKLKDNFLNIILLVTIFLVLIFPLLYWISLEGNWQTNSVVESRNLAVLPEDTIPKLKRAIKYIFQGKLNKANELFFNKVVYESIQKQITSAMADQFPYRIELTKFSRAIERGLIDAAYLVVPDPAIPASLDSHYFITSDKSRLLPQPVSFNLIDKQNIDLRIENYKKILENNPQVNFYVFNIEIIENSKFHPLEAFFNNADNGQSLRYFMENKSANLQFMNFGITSYQDFDTNFFKTDQHWNINGALKAYRLIYKMLSSKYLDISPMVHIKKVSIIEGVEFLGTYARRSLYPIKPDRFEYADAVLPAYKSFINGQLTVIGTQDQYLSGNFSRNQYTNHYGLFYGPSGLLKKLIMFEFQNTSKRNLLILGSSHVRMIESLLASHYHRTYIIDLRDEDVKATSLKQIINDYQIDDVLIIGQPSVSYLSPEYLMIQ